MDKKVKKKVKIRVLPFLIVFICIGLLFLLGKVLFEMPIFNIIVTGNDFITDQEIIEYAEIEEYPSFLLTFSSTIKKKVEKNPWITSCKVSKNSFGKVKIKVNEAIPLFEKVEEKLLVLSNSEEIPSNEYNLSITGLLNHVPSTKYKTLIKQMNKVDSSVRYLISEMTYLPNDQDKDRFLLYMSDGNYVYLTLTKFEHINYYEQVLEKLDGKKGILYLDSGNHFQIMEENGVE